MANVTWCCIVDNAGVKEEKSWDIFCQVVDNFGDLGVCWRLAVDLAGRGQRVRLWTSDRRCLRWMAPQGAAGVEVRDWPEPIDAQELVVGQVLIEAFGCQLPAEIIETFAKQAAASGGQGAWINLEYLSAEAYTGRSHGLRSPLLNGPGKGLIKHFFYPGFTAQTGGLLREPGLAQRQRQFNRERWLESLGITFAGERLISLFCYEPAALEALLEQLASAGRATRLLVTNGRATAAVLACVARKSQLSPPWNSSGMLSICYLPALTQVDFDHLLWACDLNFVRGEDSLVRALWAGQAFVWQLYPQHDAAHHAKLEAFLTLLGAPCGWRDFHRVWNEVPHRGVAQLPTLDDTTLRQWEQVTGAVRKRLWAQDDLVTQLIAFVAKNH